MQSFVPIRPGSVRLLPSLFQQRAELGQAYLMSLRNDNLLRNYYIEAGLWNQDSKPEGIHWGWDSPTSLTRSNYFGQWLWAAARTAAQTGDAQVKAKADHIVHELGRCQQANGGEWVFAYPTKWLDWLGKGQRPPTGVWAPQYYIHKTLMGLLAMHTLTGNQEALEIVEKAAPYVYRWCRQFPQERWDDMLDIETGAMIELWADLYGLTGKAEYKELMERYYRPRLFDPLLAGQDPLTNKHANQTIPEALGAARAWEVTGEKRWRDVAEAYWRQAVTERGYYATGGQTCGEIWTPKFELAARLGHQTQEHCVVFHMMMLADYLLRWTGDAVYADYWERNLYNGILAQQHPQTGMVTYYLPMQAGGKKIWSTPTETFWCCVGTLFEAQTLYPSAIYFTNREGLVVSQYIPSVLSWEHGGAAVQVTQTLNPLRQAVHRPQETVVDLEIACASPSEFALTLRLPWWLAGPATVTINGVPQPVTAGAGSFWSVRRMWGHDQVRLSLPKRLTTCPLPDRPSTVAFMDGPVVLAGLCDEERMLHGDPARAETMLEPDNEREWGIWRPWYKTVGQERGIRFVPLYEITDEPYAVYFPTR